MSEKRGENSNESGSKFEGFFKKFEAEDVQAISETEASPMRGTVDVKTMPIKEIDARDPETWLRGYDANGLKELEEDPELIVSEAESLGVDSEELIEMVLAESKRRIEAFITELDSMSEEELKRRYVDSINGEGPETDFAFTFADGNLREYDKLIAGHIKSLFGEEKIQEWWDNAWSI